MSTQTIELTIHKLHLKVISATGFHRSNATPQYLQTICRMSTLLEQDLTAYILKGSPVTESTKIKVAELRRFACT